MRTWLNWLNFGLLLQRGRLQEPAWVEHRSTFCAGDGAFLMKLASVVWLFRPYQQGYLVSNRSSWEKKADFEHQSWSCQHGDALWRDVSELGERQSLHRVLGRKCVSTTQIISCFVRYSFWRFTRHYCPCYRFCSNNGWWSDTRCAAAAPSCRLVKYIHNIVRCISADGPCLRASRQDRLYITISFFHYWYFAQVSH